MCPCRPFNDRGFVYLLIFARYLVVVFLRDIWVLRDPTFSADEKKKSRKRLGRGTLNLCAKIQGLTLKNGGGIWPFVWINAKITGWHLNYLVLVYIRFWALKLT